MEPVGSRVEFPHCRNPSPSILDRPETEEPTSQVVPSGQRRLGTHAIFAEVVDLEFRCTRSDAAERKRVERRNGSLTL